MLSHSVVQNAMNLTFLSCLCAVVRFSALAFNPSNNQASYRSRTSLGVSEIHIPAYRETKIPFILNDEYRGDHEHSVGTVTLNKEPTFSSDDFESMIPHQGGHLVHKTKFQVFSQSECQAIIDEAEKVASKIEWTKNRHGNFPTTDLPLVELPDSLQFLRHALVERIYPILSAQFGSYLPDPTRLRVADGFVVKYDALGGQNELKPHRDGSVLSFNIALNPASDFDGGGTWFASLDDAVKIDQGEMVSHASSLLHGGHGITSGKRYIVVAFVILEGYDSWSMRFYNEVRNM